MKQVAKVIPVNLQNQILLVLRDNKPEIAYPDYWSEIGGEVEKTETPLEALKREIKEEISCEIQNLIFLGNYENKEQDCNVFVFRGELSEKLENIRLYEGQKLGLFRFNELKNIKIVHFVKDFILNNKQKIFAEENI